MEADIMTAISSVGFPIVAYFFTTTKLAKTIESNTDAINKMSESIAQCPKK